MCRYPCARTHTRARARVPYVISKKIGLTPLVCCDFHFPPVVEEQSIAEADQSRGEMQEVGVIESARSPTGIKLKSERTQFSSEIAKSFHSLFKHEFE